MTCWLGVDVGAPRKGFDVALVDERRLLTLRGGLSLTDVTALVAQARPRLVGIDSPGSCAPAGTKARECERRLAREVCGIRWTPDEVEVYRNPYYAWTVHGLRLFQALTVAGTPAVEVFPTASWTRWLGPRGARSRAEWTHEGLNHLGVDGIPARTNQDQRDAIAAAVTVRQHDRGATETIGEIVVPSRR